MGLFNFFKKEQETSDRDLRVQYRYNMMHDLFVEIAAESFLNAENAYIEINKQTNMEPNDKTHELASIIRKECIKTVCFSAMALESFINTLAASYISESFAETIDRLDVQSKWILTIRLGAGIELSRGEKPIQRIIQCVQKRNAFVHNKSKSLKRCQDCGGLHIPEMNLFDDYMIPAYEALKALQDSSDWIDSNWKESALNINVNIINEKIKSKFKTVENTWVLSEPVECFR